MDASVSARASRSSRRALALALTLSACDEDDPAPSAPAPAAFADPFDATAFRKGNLHTHTRLSDGDASPEDTIAWYRAHGYDFLAITDHNRRSEPADYASLQDERFVLIAGEEITMTGAGRQVHVNGLCTSHRIGGGSFDSQAHALEWAVSSVREQGGVAVVNHPNFDRALVLDDVLRAREAPLLEIASGHPYVFSNGLADRPSHEALWDETLVAGARFTGVAVDDMHHLAIDADPPAFPGKAWVEVFSAANDRSAICGALAEGRLYASTGPALDRICVTRDTYEVRVHDEATVIFVGDGRELARSTVHAGHAASYRLHDEHYVRARVEEGQRGIAWTPPAFRELTR